MTFNELNFDSKIASILRAQGFNAPTPIQAQAIPVIREGTDLIGIAQTGTGKTAAFVLPLVEKLAATQSRHVRALIVVPTRELADQVNEVVRIFGRPLGLRSVTAFGGTSMNRQIQELRRGVDIVIGCPGRLLDHLERNTLNLSRLESLILDEADQMFDMGFLPTVRRILRFIPESRQTLLFSATMPPDVRQLANETVRDPRTIKIGNGAAATTVSHALYPVGPQLKTELLNRLLKKTDTESVLVFVRTKHRAKSLSKGLEKRGFNVTSLQGNLSQSRRQAAMNGFRSGKYQILVATDIAARGIDIQSVSHVINYDVPSTVEAYTHRIGRTGRAARTGDAYSLVTPEDRSIVRSIERALGSKIERRTLEDFNYGEQPMHEPEANPRFNRGPRRNDNPRRHRRPRR